MIPRSGAGRSGAAPALLLVAVLAAGHGAPAVADAGALVAEACGEGIVRFFASPAVRQDHLPSLALVRPLTATGPAAPGFPVHPVFQRIAGRAAARIAVEPGTSLYGTGEAAGPLLRNGHRCVAWNFDAYGYDTGSLSLYQSHPWVLAVRADGSAFGVLADTSYRCLLDLTQDILIVADGPDFPLLVIDRDSPQAVLEALAQLVGTLPLPPLWALGYHQCRYSYTPASRVLEVAREFRRRHIPCDVIWLDIDYMDGYRCFTFHPQDFPDPDGLTRQLHEQGFRTVAILDPGIKEEPGYAVYDSGTQLDVWVRTRLGEPYRGTVWPGTCVFPDFTSASVRGWWAGWVGGFLAHGLDGLWNDMNEPAIFNVESKTMPLDNRHRADPELGGPGPHARYHNVYGMLMARASQEGMLAARPERRPFVLSRANFLGGQRYAACWTGDNTATWEHLDLSIPMALNLGLSGQPFCGPDIGGFAGDGGAHLFARWLGFGALLPFARGHTGKGQRDKEPWAFGPEVEQICRLALQRRYRLLPFLYTLFEEASRSGLPVARPLFFADPADPALRSADDAFLLGDDLLVAVQTAPGTRRAAVPSAFADWAGVTGVFGDAQQPDLPDLCLRPGAILPLGPVREHVAPEPADPLTLLICPDGEGHAEGWLYEDVGEGFGYRRGEFRRLLFAARCAGDTLVVTSRVVEGDWERPERRLEVYLLSASGAIHFGPLPDSATLRLVLPDSMTCPAVPR